MEYTDLVKDFVDRISPILDSHLLSTPPSPPKPLKSLSPAHSDNEEDETDFQINIFGDEFEDDFDFVKDV